MGNGMYIFVLLHIWLLRSNHISVIWLNFDQQKSSNIICCLLNSYLWHYKGIARTQSPTIKNYALELPTFGVIVGVSLTGVQWRGLTLEEPPSWSWLTSAPGKYAEGSYHFWLDESEFRGLIDANCKLCQRKKTLLKILVLFSTKHTLLILSTIVLYTARTTPSDKSPWSYPKI